jgi:Ulp1 family protease
MRLRPGTWLNDEVVNAYVSLINEEDPANTMAFNTFFFT